MKLSKNKKAIAILAIAIVIVILMVLIIIISNNEKDDEIVKAVLSEEQLNEETINKQKNMTERDRIDYYFSIFLNLVESKKYEQAYDLLYSEYKERYFPELEDFKIYMETYFPKSATVKFNNIERLGNIYVLWIDIGDLVNGSLGKNFSMNVVIKEEGLNNYKLSFSMDSAIKALNNEG